jgi:CRP-like cAMP-binding protein
VLREDSDLAEAITAGQRPQAIEDCTAPHLEIPTGNWPTDITAMPGDAIGMLVLEGMLIRRLGVQGRYGAELLGEGDLLRPWQTEEEEAGPLALSVRWTVLEPLRAALLDAQFARQLARYPQLSERLVARTTQRARNLAVNMAIVHHARVDVRLHLLFWHLASRWGRVRSDGTVLPLRLTHSLLAELVAARRPTVTSALSDLARRGLVLSVGDAWLLAGEPPAQRPA